MLMLSSRLDAICGGFQNIHEIWAVPVELGIALWLLERQTGIYFLNPAAVSILSTVGVVGISRYIGGSQKIWNQGIQTRVDVTASMLGSMKVETNQSLDFSDQALIAVSRPSKCSASLRSLQKFFKAFVS